MAEFNPQINPTRDPTYLGYSQGVSQPEGDKSLGTLFKGIGDTFEMGVKAADTVVKDIIDNKVYDVANAERDAYTAALEIKREGSGGQPLDIMQSDAKTPDALKTLPNKLERLKAIGEQRPDLEVLYSARVRSLAKALRAEYPGYREYIDSKFSSILGTDPANAYINALTNSIKTLSETGKDERNRVLQIMKEKAGIPGLQAVGVDVLSGKKPITALLEHVASYETVDSKLKRNAAIRADNKGSREEKEADATTDARTLASNNLNAHLEGFKAGVGGNSPEAVRDFMVKVQQGLVPRPTEEQLRQLGESISTGRAELIAKNRKDMIAKGIYKTLGPEASEKIIAESVKSYDSVMDMFYNKDYGGAFTTSNMVKASVNETQREPLQDQHVGQYVRDLAAIRQLTGDQFVQQWYTSLLGDGTLQKGWDSVIASRKTRAIAPKDLRTIPLNTIKQDFEAFNKSNAPAKAYDSLLGVVDVITNPNASEPIKTEAARYLFSEGAQGLINLIQPDSKDPEKNRNKPGKYAAFTRLTAPDVTKEMVKLGGKDPKIFSDYVAWANNTFATELFNREIQDLNRYQGFPGFKVTWDTENHRLQTHWSAVPRTLDNIEQSTYQRAIDSTVARINSGLHSISNIAKETNSDVSAYLLKVLSSTGAKISVSGQSQPVTVSEHIIQAIVSSAGKEKLQKEMTK